MSVVSRIAGLLLVLASSVGANPPRSDGRVLHADLEPYTDGVVQPLNAGVRWLGDPFTGRKEGTVEITRGFAFAGTRCVHVRSAQPDEIARVRLQPRYDAPKLKGDSVAEFVFRPVRDVRSGCKDLTVWSAKSHDGKPVGLTILANSEAADATYRLDVVHGKESAGRQRTDAACNDLDPDAWIRIILHRRQAGEQVDLWVGPPGKENKLGAYPDLNAPGQFATVEIGDTSTKKFFGSGYWDDIRIGGRLESGGTVAPPEPRLRDVGAEPVVIERPIVVGREKQLFVDDAVIESMTGLTRTLHPVRKHPANPLIVPDRPWEGPAVLLYGAVVRDPASKKFRMWYLAWNAHYAKTHKKPEERSFICYAESDDGLNWTKPNVGRYDYRGSKDNNIVIGYGMSNTTIIHDPRDPDPSRRFKGVLRRNGLRAYLSPDGFDWRDAGVIIDQGYDSTTVHWDPVSNKWIASVKIFRDGKRVRGYAESRDFFNWSDTYFMAATDDRDGPKDQMYSMTIFRYESLYLGLLRMYHTDSETIDIQLTSSRNARKWDRTFREPLIPTTPAEGSWDYGNNAPATNPPIRMGDDLWFYYSGRSTPHNVSPNTGAIGLATLRVDRFVSVDAKHDEGVLTTKPLKLEGKRLYINADAENGAVVIEIIDETGQPIDGLSFNDCSAFRKDEVRHVITWKNGGRLPSDPGGDVRLRFRLRSAELYAFWCE